MGQNAGYFNKANQPAYSFFFFSFKKNCLKKIKRIMLSYLLLFNKRLEFDFFKTPSKIPTCTSQGNSLKICSICILPQRKTLPQIIVLN